MSDQNMLFSVPARSSLGALWPELTDPARVLPVFTLIYLIFGSLFLAATGSNPFLVLAVVAREFSEVGRMVYNLVPAWVHIGIATCFVIIGPLRQRLKARLVPAVAALVCCLAFVCMFSSVKANMNIVSPFWADDLLTSVDVAFHFGRTPHELFGWMAKWNTSNLSLFYLNSWVLIATFFPAILIFCDPNEARRRQFILLWLAAWVVLGNVVAILFLSYGPIFADMFPNGNVDAHASALALFERDDAGLHLYVKEKLWMSYSGESNTLGSGISAFPSVHVGMAMVLGLYIHRIGCDLAQFARLKSVVARWLPSIASVAAAGYVFVYLALSIYLGWHYAVDGYASIAIIGGLYFALIRAARQRATPARSALQSGSLIAAE